MVLNLVAEMQTLYEEPGPLQDKKVSHCLLVRNLNKTLQVEILIHELEKSGPLRNLNTKHLKGEGFVVADYFDLRHCVKAFKAVPLFLSWNSALCQPGIRLDVHYFVAGSPDPNSGPYENEGKILIFNLPPEINSVDFQKELKAHGDIRKISTTTQSSTWIVEYYDVRAAAAAYTQLENNFFKVAFLNGYTSWMSAGYIEKLEAMLPFEDPVLDAPYPNASLLSMLGLNDNELLSPEALDLFGSLNTSALATPTTPTAPLPAGLGLGLGLSSLESNLGPTSTHGTVSTGSSSHHHQQQHHHHLAGTSAATIVAAPIGSMTSALPLPLPVPTMKSMGSTPNLGASSTSTQSTFLTSVPVVSRQGRHASLPNLFAHRRTASRSPSPTRGMGGADLGMSSQYFYQTNQSAASGQQQQLSQSLISPPGSASNTHPPPSPIGVPAGSYLPSPPTSPPSRSLSPPHHHHTHHHTHHGSDSKHHPNRIPESFHIDLDAIRTGLDRRTTLMIRNIPNKYTQDMFLDFVNETHKGKYDFIYLPIDFKNKCNVGYAFINFIDPVSIAGLYERIQGKKWTRFNSEKICAVSYGRIQGKDNLIRHFQNSTIMGEVADYRPKIFYSSGPAMGLEEVFPEPSASSYHEHESHRPHHHDKIDQRRRSQPHLHSHNSGHSHGSGHSHSSGHSHTGHSGSHSHGSGHSHSSGHSHGSGHSHSSGHSHTGHSGSHVGSASSSSASLAMSLSSMSLQGATPSASTEIW